MIKRRFYKFEHGDGDAPSDSSSSSSDSEIEPQSSQDSDDDVDDDVEEELQASEDAQSCSTSSGYQSEDSSANEVHVDSSGLPVNEDDATTGNERTAPMADQFGKSDSELLEEKSTILANVDSLPVDLPDCIVKCKSAFKCRICPRIVCLNEESVRAHLKSKRHARSEKLLDEGRLKTMLNTDGKIDEEDTPALYAKILANTQGMPRKKSKRQDKKVPRNKRMRYGAKPSRENPAKRGRRK